MMKLLKILGLVVGILAALLVLAIVLLVTFVSPNRFKPVLADRMMKYSGRELAMDGNLSWTFFPTIGVHIGHTTLGNPAGFSEKTFAEISEATLSVRVLPLLRGRVESTGLVLKGARLHLITKADGETNWVLAKNPQKESSPTKDASTVSSSSWKRAPLGLAISGIDISDAEVTWDNQQTKQSYDITHFSLTARRVDSIEPFPVATSFDFVAKNPAATGSISFHSNVAFNLEKQIFSFRDMSLTADVHQQNKKIHAVLTGGLVADLVQETMQWANLKGQVANMDVSANVNVTHMLSSPVVTGQAHVKPFDLKKTLQQVGEVALNLQSATGVSGDVSFTATPDATTAQGKFTMMGLQVANIRVGNIAAQMQFQNKILTFSPISAGFYQGTFDGTAKIDLNNAEPQYAIQGRLVNVQAAPLLKDLSPDQKIKIVGAGRVELQVTTSGSDVIAIKRNLNGTGQLNFNNGYIEGIDVGFLLNSARMLLSKQITAGNNTNQTQFGSLSASAQIKNGIVSNNDLFLDSPSFEVKGKGAVNLPANTIDFELATSAKSGATQRNDITNLFGVTVPIDISGNLNHPRIALNSGELLKSVAESQLKNAVAGKVEDQLKGGLPANPKDLLQGLFGH